MKTEYDVIFGFEPKFDVGAITDENYNSVIIPALSWYGRYGGVSNDKALNDLHRLWLKEWAVQNSIDAKTYTIPREGIATAAAAARLANLGFPLKEADVNFLKAKFVSWPKEVAAVAAPAKLNKLLDEEKIKPFLTAFDNVIDSILEGATKWKVESLGALSGVHGAELKAMYKNALREVKLVYSGKDDELAEAYSMGRVKIRRLLNVYEDILRVIDESMMVKKVQRKPRVKKLRMASDVVKKLKYAQSNSEFALVSVDPAKAVKADVVYTFDVKNRMLKQFKGTGPIDIKGQTLKNCTVLQKKIRKPKEQLIEFANGTRLQCQKAFDAIKAKANDTAGRVNADTIFLKVF